MKPLLRSLILLALVSLGVSLKCFICNSHNDPDCKAMPEKAKPDFLKDCNEAPDDNTNYTLCRKLHMFMDQSFGELHPHEDRVHRACGFIEDTGYKRKGDCYYKSGYNTRTWVCSCNYDECNAAPGLSPSPALALLTLAAIAGCFRAVV